MRILIIVCLLIWLIVAPVYAVKIVIKSPTPGRWQIFGEQLEGTAVLDFKLTLQGEKAGNVDWGPACASALKAVNSSLPNQLRMAAVTTDPFFGSAVIATLQGKDGTAEFSIISAQVVASDAEGNNLSMKIVIEPSPWLAAEQSGADDDTILPLATESSVSTGHRGSYLVPSGEGARRSSPRVTSKVHPVETVQPLEGEVLPFTLSQSRASSLVLLPDNWEKKVIITRSPTGAVVTPGELVKVTVSGLPVGLTPSVATMNAKLGRSYHVGPGNWRLDLTPYSGSDPKLILLLDRWIIDVPMNLCP